MTLKQEALQHLFIAIAGTDCRELWNLLTLFFSKGSDHDPFEFLDAAPTIKKPLDLVDTDNDDEASVADSSASTATTAPDPMADSPKTPRPATPSGSASKDFKLPARPTWTNLHASIELAEGFVPQSAGLLHHTGIPEGISCKRSDTQMARGASLYICPHPSCGSTPYIGDLPGCGLHLHCVHYSTCLLCPFCPNKRYYHMSGWKDHMNSKHRHVPWYGASEELQAKLTLAAFTTPDVATSDVTVTQQQLTVSMEPASATSDPTPTPEPFASFTAPLPLPEPVKEEPPVEDTLAYEEDVDPSSSDLSPKTEQSLLDPPPEEMEKHKMSTPSEEDIKEAAMFSPSDLRQYDYAINHQSGIMIRYRKGPDPSKSLAASIVQQDIASPDPTEAPPQKKPKVSSMKVWPRKNSGHTLLYQPPKSDDDGPPSMV